MQYTNDVMRQTIAAFGPIGQMSWVTDDLDRSMQYWLNLGLGPFFVFDFKGLQMAKTYGNPVELNVSAAMTYWGDMHIELIRSNNDAPTVYKSWWDSGQHGLHHVRIDSPDPQKLAQFVEDRGGIVALEADVPGVANVRYYDVGRNGPYLEIPIGDNAAIRRFRKVQRDAVQSWDGSNPIRYL